MAHNRNLPYRTSAVEHRTYPQGQWLTVTQPPAYDRTGDVSHFGVGERVRVDWEYNAGVSVWRHYLVVPVYRPERGTHAYIDVDFVQPAEAPPVRGSGCPRRQHASATA